MLLSTIGMPRVLWVLMTKPNSTLLPWHRGCMNLVIIQKTQQLELWHRLNHVMDLPEMERLLANNSEEVDTEYNNFIQQLSDFVNQEISNFGHRFTLLEETLGSVQNVISQVRGASQTISERMDGMP